MIIPNYNHADFLVQRIESVLSQTYQDFEVILLDDASTDSSHEILNRYRNHPKVSQLIINTTNSGSTFHQWKRGTSLATGNWIWIAESDDWAEPTFLETVMSFVAEHPQAGVVMTRYQVVSVEGAVKHDGLMYQELYGPPGRWNRTYCCSGHEEVVTCMNHFNSIPNASCVVFRTKYRELISTLPGFRFKGDWYFWCLVLADTSFGFIDSLQSYFRFHSSTTRSKADLDSRLKAHNEELAIVCEISHRYGTGNRRFLQKTRDWYQLALAFYWVPPGYQVPSLTGQFRWMFLASGLIWTPFYWYLRVQHKFLRSFFSGNQP